VSEKTGIDWSQAEKKLRLHSWYVCGWCEDAPGNVCDAHRCHGSTARGTRCKKAVSDENPMYCAQHQCSVRWVLDGEEITCTHPAAPQVLPDGRKVRICDQHREMLSGRDGVEATAFRKFG
jgi:hypothetical protein